MKKLILLLITFNFQLSIFHCTAQCTLDQSQPLTDGGTSERNLPGYYDGQTFMAGGTGLLCEVDVLMFNTMTGTLTLNIYSGSGIAGPLLATQVVNVVVPTGQVWQNWTLNSPPAVKKDSVYTFQFVPIQGGGLPDPYGVNVEGADVYAGGYDLTFPQFDMTFKTYIESTTGIEENNSESTASVYPNPARDEFVVSSREPGRKSISIYDITGREVHSVQFNDLSTIINQQLTSGIYFVRVRTAENEFTQKLIIE